MPNILASLNSYQSVKDKDPYANLMVQAAVTNSSVGVLLNMLYLKPVANHTAFNPFDGIPTLADTTSIRSFVDFMAGAEMPNIPRYVSYLQCIKKEKTSINIAR